MEENRNLNRDSNEKRVEENDDQLRPNTMNEAIREVSGNPDADLSKLGGSGRENIDSDLRSDSGSYSGSDASTGVGYNPNDMSAVRSGGTTDMDDQTAGGAGLNSGERKGAGSNLTTRRTVTGSDFDGQDKTS
ncbi:MAG: hypothetical protein EOO10_21455 [Chitinophagaceae bacterium]|nr:MAG: hypothetical protein EOO10_21455 [Chitinophagaceae bacterium]